MRPTTKLEKAIVGPLSFVLCIGGRIEMGLEAVLAMTLTAYTDADSGMNGLGIMTSGLSTFDGACACGPLWPFGAVFFVPSLQRG